MTSQQVFVALSSAKMASIIQKAGRRIILAAPALFEGAAEALLTAHDRLGSDSVTVVVDCDEEVFRLGYHRPCPSHVHHDGWRKDVDYQSPTRRAALLVGDPKKSFLWSRPVISVPFRIARGQKKMSLIDLLDSLQEL